MTSAEIAPCPTEQQKHFAAAYLASTRDELTPLVSRLTAAQSSFRREPGEWCIAEIVEHLAILESRIQTLITRLPDAAPSEPGRQDAEIDELILQAVPGRTSRVQAPEAAWPQGQCTAFEALQNFIGKRDETVALLESASCLRGRVLPHPIFGPWDGYQWILAAAAHTARHLSQIREIQGAEAFPNSPAMSPA